VLNVHKPFAWTAHWVERMYQPELHEKSVTLPSHKAHRSLGRWMMFRLRQALQVGPKCR